MTDDASPIVLPDDPSFGTGGPGRLPGLPLDALPRTVAPARARCPRSSIRSRARSSARTRSRSATADLTTAARRRAARRADHRLGPRARHRRPADPQRARRGLAGERGRPLPPPGRRASGAARPELLGRGPVPDRRRRHLPVHHRQARRRIRGATTRTRGVRRTSTSRSSAGCSPSGSSRRCTSRATRCSRSTRSSTRCAIRRRGR